MKQLFASALLLLAPAWVMAQGSGAATPAKPASAKQATTAKAKPTNTTKSSTAAAGNSKTVVAKAQQTINPEASQDMDPVTGIDGKAAKEGIDRYHESFKTPPSTAGILTIDVLGGGK